MVLPECFLVKDSYNVNQIRTCSLAKTPSLYNHHILCERIYSPLQKKDTLTTSLKGTGWVDFGRYLIDKSLLTIMPNLVRTHFANEAKQSHARYVVLQLR